MLKVNSLIGSNIALALNVNHLSLRALADRTGISRRAISRIMSGEIDARWSILERIAKELRTTPQALVAEAPTLYQTTTGIEGIDQAVIAIIMAEVFPEYIAVADKCIDPTYMCSSSHYDGQLPLTKVDPWPAASAIVREQHEFNDATTKLSGWLRDSDLPILGITWEQEKALNAEWQKNNKFVTKSIEIKHIFIHGSRRIQVLDEVSETVRNTEGESGSGMLTKRVTSQIVSLVAARPFRSDVSPKWCRKFWNAYSLSKSVNEIGSDYDNKTQTSNAHSHVVGRFSTNGAF